MAYHEFLIHGSNEVFLVHKPSFYVPNHRNQAILKVNLSDSMTWYKTIKAQYPDEVFTFKTVDRVNLIDTLKRSAKLKGYITSSKT